jgi:hypothetical protein
MLMTTDATTHGHAAASGKPTNGDSATPKMPAPTAIRAVAERVSLPILIAAFQPAWQAAANRTAAKTRESKRPLSDRTFTGYG